MEFDKSKVYTALNADEVKNGSRGYFADTINGLRGMVEQEPRLQYGAVRIRGDYELYRFHFECEGEERDLYDYNLFYLVEEPKKEEFRSYQSTDEMVDNFMKRFHLLPQIHQLPIIWIKNKDNGQKSFILDYGKTVVTTSTRTMSMEYLFEHYVYLDDSPCGIKED